MHAYDPKLEERDITEQGWDEGDELPEDFYGDELPITLNWRLLIMPIRPRTVSKGGIVLPQTNQEAQKYLTYIGKIINIGSLAYTDKRISGEVNKPVIGDYVVYGRYAGQIMVYKGVRLLIVNDDEILAIVTNPIALQRSN